MSRYHSVAFFWFYQNFIPTRKWPTNEVDVAARAPANENGMRTQGTNDQTDKIVKLIKLNIEMTVINKMDEAFSGTGERMGWTVHSNVAVCYALVDGSTHLNFSFRWEFAGQPSPLVAAPLCALHFKRDRHHCRAPVWRIPK